MERLIFARASAVTSVTSRVLEEWKLRYPQWQHKMHTLWNGFDPADALPPVPPSARGYKVLAHVGDLYGTRHPGALLDSIDRLIEAGRLDPASLKVRLIGPIETPALRPMPSFTRLAAAGCLEYNDRRVARDEAMRVIAESDLLLLLDMNEKNLGHAVPAKLFDYVRSGHPMMVFTPRNSLVQDVIARSGIPHAFVHPDTPAAELDRTTADFLALPARPSAPSEWFLENFDGRRQTAQLAELLDSLA